MEAVTGHSTTSACALQLLRVPPSPISPKKGAQQPPYSSALVYCGHTVAHLSYCWALVHLHVEEHKLNIRCNACS